MNLGATMARNRYGLVALTVALATMPACSGNSLGNLGNILGGVLGLKVLH